MKSWEALDMNWAFYGCILGYGVTRLNCGSSSFLTKQVSSLECVYEEVWGNSLFFNTQVVSSPVAWQ